ncbi:hypothetical protein C8R47DRAFT_1236500 [Mycena vitilis]|nr:hypothetical protein C8R47DRAFT_1236500 [Mycena vitilis]
MAQPCWSCGAPPVSIAATSLLGLPNIGTAHLALGGKAPLESDTACLRDSLSAARNQVDNLGFAIQHVRTTLEQLLDRCERLRGAIAPIRRMPAELLCEVFSWLGLGGEDLRIPWRLAGVCQRWRVLAIEYGPLWSYITLPSLLAPDHTRLKLKIRERSVGYSPRGAYRGSQHGMIRRRAKPQVEIIAPHTLRQFRVRTGGALASCRR